MEQEQNIDEKNSRTYTQRKTKRKELYTQTDPKANGGATLCDLFYLLVVVIDKQTTIIA